jgi:cell fate (sporulation/competence/biofilm development) regulator YlbF (YheA/YmcA/DUF963 family)
MVDMNTFIEEADHLAQTLLQAEEVKHYQLSRQRLIQDQEAQRLIHHFTAQKNAFEEAERFGKYHPDYQRLNKEMREAKRRMDMNESVATFKKAERALESILNEISQVLAYAVSEQIKVPNGNPFWDSMGCGTGGCGSGGCGTCGN